MDEMLSILQRADSKTLILGDEMCKGTETKSAVTINYSLLSELIEKNVFFITATHLHELNEYIKLESKVKVCHMKVTFDKEGNAIFDRKLQPDSGPELYGLEIARNLNFPKSFMEKAMKFRSNFIWGTKNPVKKSRYNSKKIVAKCQVCDYKPPNEKSLPLDTHHLDFQCNAKDGYHTTQKVKIFD